MKKLKRNEGQSSNLVDPFLSQNNKVSTKNSKSLHVSQNLHDMFVHSHR